MRRARKRPPPGRFCRVTGPLRALPDFLILGAMKAGTTSLHAYLCAHSGVRPAHRKEIHFFDDHFELGTGWYRAHFPFRFSGRLTGEASPSYLFDPRVPARAREVAPRARLVVLLRNPIDRAFSHYHHSRRVGREPLPFAEAVEKEPGRLDEARERAAEGDPRGFRCLKAYSYLARGRYAEQLERWTTLFPPEQLLVLNSERFFREPAETMERVFGFLGLAPEQAGRYGRYNSGKYQDEIDPALRRRLAEYFAPHNRRLYDLCGEEYGWEA